MLHVYSMTNQSGDVRAVFTYKVGDIYHPLLSLTENLIFNKT